MRLSDESTQRVEVGKRIREAREQKGWTQLRCAEEVEISDKTWGKYERGEIEQPNLNLLRKIAVLLGIDLDSLNLHTYPYYTSEEAHSLLERAAVGLEQGRFSEAALNADSVINSLTYHGADTVQLQTLLARAYFLAGHAHSILSEKVSIKEPLAYFQKMGMIARNLGDETLINVALTYQGEMLRRGGNLKEALRIFKNVPRGNTVELAPDGNSCQLLARVYLSIGDRKNFEHWIVCAEDLASRTSVKTCSLYIPFNLGSVYEEWARFHAQQGNIDESMKYLQLLQSSMPYTPRWNMLEKMIRAEVLIRAVVNAEQRQPVNIERVPEYIEGRALLEKVVKLAHKYGHQRMLRRVEDLPTKLFKQASRCHLLAEDIQKVVSAHTMADGY
jgi:transcriptional regulator with XRE-family HTH domain